MKENKYKHTIAYSVDRKTIEISKGKDIGKGHLSIISSQELEPKHVAWVLIHYLKGNGLKEIKTKFGTLELKEKGELTSAK